MNASHLKRTALVPGCRRTLDRVLSDLSLCFCAVISASDVLYTPICHCILAVLC